MIAATSMVSLFSSPTLDISAIDDESKMILKDMLKNTPTKQKQELKEML